MKEHLVIPFKPQVGKKTGFGTDVVAQQVQSTIVDYTNQGWTYLGIESISTVVKGDGGCFGIGSTPDRTTFVQVIVFER
jgi:hypothetical protein